VSQVSAIVVSWNTRELLSRCLAALERAGAGLDLETWVVDNHSGDGSPAMVAAQYPQVHLLQNGENMGFARANNQVACQVSGEYLLLLNSDAFLAPDALRTLLDSVAQYPDTAILGARLLNEDGSLQRSCFSFPTLATELWQTLGLDRAFPSSRVFGKYLMTYWDMDDLREVDVVMGACMLVRRSALAGQKLFDEDYFMYSEEVDLCWRVKQAGWAVRYQPCAQAVHLWGGSARQVKVETLLRLYHSRVIFFRKHYGGLVAGLYKGLLCANSLSRALLGGLAARLTARQGLRDKAAGYWQVFRHAPTF
jgi:GT2 family glycosyltransferase